MNGEELLSLEPKSFWKYFLKTSVPPWKPNFTSQLLDIAKTTYQEIYDTEAKAKTIQEV